jgi:excisionase family DNA binding protein
MPTKRKGSRYEPKVPAKFERRILTKAEAALYLGVSENWIEKACQRHQIPYRKVGGHRRFFLDDLEKWLETVPKIPVREQR